MLPDGTPLKANNIIIYSPYGMGRMTSIWGPDAKDFKPERWLQSGKFLPVSEFKFTAFQVIQDKIPWNVCDRIWLYVIVLQLFPSLSYSLHVND